MKFIESQGLEFILEQHKPNDESVELFRIGISENEALINMTQLVAIKDAIENYMICGYFPDEAN